MGYTYDFKDNEYYSADDINSIRSAFITAGVLGSVSPAMKVTSVNGGVIVSAGTAIFADGSRITVDSDGIFLVPENGVKNYVYLLCDTLLNKNTVNISTDEPSGDFLMLAEIDETGAVCDRRTFAVAKYAALAPQRYVVNIEIPGATKGWTNSEFIKLCDLDIDRSLRYVTAVNCYDYGVYTNLGAFIGGDGVEIKLYNSNSSDDIDIFINDNYEVFAKAKTNATYTLIFENMVEGNVLYA